MTPNGTFSVRRLLSVLLSAALLCGVLAACGPGGAEATPTPTQTPPAADTPTPRPTQAPATPAPTPEATPEPSAPSPTGELVPPTESGGESPTPEPTPEATPDAPGPGPTAEPTMPPPSQTPGPTSAPTPAPTQEPELSCNVPDATSLKAAGLTAGQKIFTNGVTAEQFLAQVNNAIARWELVFSDTYGSNGPSDQFNWHTSLTGEYEGQTVLTQVKREVLSALRATNANSWTDAYNNFDIQVYYSQLIDLLGQPLPWGSPDYTGPALTQVA